mgnify:CR=1 FL=1|tara:strand:+ start:741 stop:1244 length:504 start_codon:yes stop_codon:yes gene_type:complete
MRSKYLNLATITALSFPSYSNAFDVPEYEDPINFATEILAQEDLGTGPQQGAYLTPEISNYTDQHGNHISFNENNFCVMGTNLDVTEETKAYRLWIGNEGENFVLDYAVYIGGDPMMINNPADLSLALGSANTHIIRRTNIPIKQEGRTATLHQTIERFRERLAEQN